MTDTEQIKAIAELLHIKLVWNFDNFWNGSYVWKQPTEGFYTSGCTEQLKRFLHSRDAIVPVIEKHWPSTELPEGVEWQIRFYQALPPCKGTMLFYSAKELSEALLRATNKWKD